MSRVILPDLDCDKTVRELIEFIKLELSQTGLERIVLGISGGVDSALVAFLSVKAVGAENLVGVIVPYKTSDPRNVKDAENLINHLGLKKYRIDITPQIDT